MAREAVSNEVDDALERVLGYLNLSSGASDAQFLASLNQLFEHVERHEPDQPAWRALRPMLQQKLDQLRRTAPAFRDTAQAEAVLGLLYDRVLGDYLRFHEDLLFHQTDRTLFQPFFLGCVCEAILQQGPPWEEAERISAGAIQQLNDYVGYRPVATLERQKLEPYPHEWVRPIPLYIRGAGVACSPYRQVVEQALELLRQTDPRLLRAAHFDPALLDELAVDPRGYDFDHPVNKRPNYHFGQWDPHHIDRQGRYRRFVVQQVTLDAMMERIERRTDLPRDETIFEAAAVLAGTMLMASGVSGSGPDAHDSSVTLSTLLPEIAAYRDAFYEQLFARMRGAHAERLQAEARALQQPFGGARQHLNAALARRRASQLEHVHLALIFARMGYPDAAARQAAVVPVASARMRCQIDCRLTAGLQAVRRGDLRTALDLSRQIMDLVHRAIGCGALIDPWNILGFDAHFSLFPALENSIHDHRADELVELMEQIFSFYSRIWSEAAAADERSICQEVDAEFNKTARWWRQFAVHEVSSVEAADAEQTYQAARHVADALNIWHKGGAASGDLGFWAPHAEMFNCPKAYALVVEALLERGDFVAAMALLIHWLSHAPQVGLEQGEGSFHLLAERWLIQLQQAAAEERLTADEAWSLARKFFDYLEANADQYWQAPAFAVEGATRNGRTDGDAADEDQAEDGLFSAAYENVVYRDSSDDGIDRDLLDDGLASEDELEREAKRINERLTFLSTVARLWTLFSTGPLVVGRDAVCRSDSQFEQVLEHWTRQAARNRQDLLQLLDAVSGHRIVASRADPLWAVQYDRQRLAKEGLLERIICTCVEMSEALHHLLAAAPPDGRRWQQKAAALELGEDEQQIVGALGCLLAADVEGLKQRCPDLLEACRHQPLLYVPLPKGGDPRKIVAARVRQQGIRNLLLILPRLGLLTETRQLLDVARTMERDHPVGPGAVTEYDELFKIGYKSMVRCLVHSASVSFNDRPAAVQQQSVELIECLERMTEALLTGWLAHSRTLRLSVLEKVKDKREWDKLVQFIQRYGKQLFTQRFFSLANLRAILHRGVDVWLGELEEQPDDDLGIERLLEDLDRVLPRAEAVERLTLVLEAIVENYGEYRDYNSTTTQSDRGDLLYTFFDFLRLRTDYDRIAWNLRPVVWAHEVLVRSGQTEAATRWRRTLGQRVRQEADKYVARLRRLQKRYAMRLPTVADRISQRFVRPMQIDRIRALVQPAMEGAGRDDCKAFELLERETARLTRKPTGVGLDVPPWLAALEEELEHVRRSRVVAAGRLPYDVLPQTLVPLERIRDEIADWFAQPS